MGGGNQTVVGASLATEKRIILGAAAGRCVDHTEGRRLQTTFHLVREAMGLVLSLIFPRTSPDFISRYIRSIHM